jgi:protein phosphatase
MAADGVPHAFLKHRDVAPADALRAAVAEINVQIHDKGENQFEFKGMGTTCSALLLTPQGALVAHVGDSRVYRLRQERLDQLSFDHSLVWELRSAGDLADAETIHLPKNIITRSLGPNAKVEVDLEGPYPIQPGDAFILCSDGLTGEVKDDELGAVLECLPPEEAARSLIDLANLRGGPDNITVIVVRILGNELATATDSAARAEPSGGVAAFFRSLLWLAAAMAAAATIGAAAALSWDVAAPAAGVAVLAAGVALLAGRWKRPPHSRPAFPPTRYGTGPHTTRDVKPAAPFVEELSKFAGQLREAAGDPQYRIEWPPFEEHCRRAAEAAEGRDYRGATREYCRAISYMMSELRNQGSKSRAGGAVHDRP